MGQYKLWCWPAGSRDGGGCRLLGLLRLVHGHGKNMDPWERHVISAPATLSKMSNFFSLFFSFFSAGDQPLGGDLGFSRGPYHDRPSCTTLAKGAV